MDKWTTSVSLARVLATSIKTSTDHGVSNLILSIRATAVIVTDNRNIHLHQDLGKAATLRGGPPSRDSAGGSSSVFLPVRWEHDFVNDRAAEISLGLPVGAIMNCADNTG